jgi:GTP-binding protein Era
MLGTKVFLELYVKAQPGWRDSRSFVDELDWRRQLEHRMLRHSTPDPRAERQTDAIAYDGRNNTEH